jgi:AMMECR1 domain-containing protein
MKTHTMKHLAVVSALLWLGCRTCCGEIAPSVSLSHEDEVALMQVARRAVLDHFGLPGGKQASPDRLKLLSQRSNRAFVLFRTDGKCRGCWSAGNQTLPMNVANAVKNTLKDARYGGPLEKDEASRIRIELFVLGEGAELKDKSLDAVRSALTLGVDSLQIARDGPDGKGATFLNYVPVCYGYASSMGKMLDRLCLKARLEEVAVPGLVKALSHEKERVRWDAFHALGEAEEDPESTVTALIPLLKSDRNALRLWAADALGAMGRKAEAAVPVLTEMLKDQDASVRAEAAQALLKIGGKRGDLPDNLSPERAAQEADDGPDAEDEPPAPRAGVLAQAVLQDPSVKLYRVPTAHLLESDDPDDVLELYRCNRLVRVEDMKEKNVSESIRLCGEWFLASMRWNGAMEYLWQANAQTYSKDNNMIRQWMATIALWDVYLFTKDERFRTAAKKNLRYNLRAFYEEDEERGFAYICSGDEAKLGASGFALRAALLISEGGDGYREVERLTNFILAVQNADGSFQTAYYPKRGKFESSAKLQRYYAGEALLALIQRYEKKKDPRLLEALRRAFPYYRDFFGRDHHPASVPWLTQAYYRTYLVDDNPEYADLIFRMNDFVISIQNADKQPEPDLLGQFYDPAHKEYGPPLAASTGVFVEGLVDAYRLARLRKDPAREQAYRQAIILGVRSLMQLQFRDDNLFYVRDVFRARGGIRGTVVSTSIRVDYTQHAVQAMIRAVGALDSWTLPKGLR